MFCFSLHQHRLRNFSNKFIQKLSSLTYLNRYKLIILLHLLNVLWHVLVKEERITDFGSILFLLHSIACVITVKNKREKSFKIETERPEIH